MPRPPPLAPPAPVPSLAFWEVSSAVRTIEIDASTPLIVSCNIVAAPVPWDRARIEFSAVTEYSEGFRLRFSDPYDVRSFAADVRRFAADCRALERLYLDIYSPFHRPIPRRTEPSHQPKPVSFMP